MLSFIGRYDNAASIGYRKIIEEGRRLTEVEVWLSKETGKFQGMEKITFDSQKFITSHGLTGFHIELSPERAQIEFKHLEKMFNEQAKKVADQKDQHEST